MSKLTKEEVISHLEAALSEQAGKTITIEQKGSWYKIDGGKSMRFNELEAMLEELGGATEPASSKSESKAPAKKQVKKTAAKTKSAASASGGLTPKEAWRQKLAGQNAKLPRGF
ncbi:hypothetical protein [Shewanella sp. GXUN23E]|uniref:hypothetical protein n=1 Tax=Shewanella sp. GXUN23E TaxID=3422498 RepID=UPI003D7C8F05